MYHKSQLGIVGFYCTLENEFDYGRLLLSTIGKNMSNQKHKFKEFTEKDLQECIIAMEKFDFDDDYPQGLKFEEPCTSETMNQQLWDDNPVE